MGWDRHKLLWDGTDKYVPRTTLAFSPLLQVVCSFEQSLRSTFCSRIGLLFATQTPLHVTALSTV